MDDGTYNRQREPVTHATGYQVGLWTRTTDAENIESVIDDITAGRNRAYTKRLRARRGYCNIPYSEYFAGEWRIWTDSDTGEIFVEPSFRVPTLRLAMQAGSLYEQRTVWCWATMKEIRVV